ncbi:hypothetical protein KLEB271_gp112 [Bacillus phage vB_BauS_KLEB27-1]|nr:hypothetical protein KLEB271_gp112 [Bacillus phage vB_BauS_KLEB27-1]
MLSYEVQILVRIFLRNQNEASGQRRRSFCACVQMRSKKRIKGDDVNGGKQTRISRQFKRKGRRRCFGGYQRPQSGSTRSERRD